MKEVTTYYLEMMSPPAPGAKRESRGLQIRECATRQYELNRSLYHLVGQPWAWIDRLSWTDEQWKAYAEAKSLRTWVAYYEDLPAGYYELQQQEGGNVEIAYFGLAPNFIGRGFGGYLLSHALASAWAWEGTRRVWVHTCTLDHPSALQNYKARGMTIYRETLEGMADSAPYRAACNVNRLA
ncbi:MAG: GNAT family N-acetyltransferase [Candidatus Pacebacteria bacterium]|nr:GNAT family N-acetyltransferase [Candidatus Paceibacterota bacterium]